jgi:hypothetical protein
MEREYLRLKAARTVVNGPLVVGIAKWLQNVIARAKTGCLFRFEARSNPPQDDFDIYMTILPSIYGSQAIWVIEQSTFTYEGNPVGDRLQTLSSETLTDFISGNQQNYPLETIFDNKDKRIVLVSRADFLEKPSPENGLRCHWMILCFNKPKFEAAYPGASGIILLSKIGYNAARTQALITTQLVNELSTGVLYVLLLAKKDGQWIVEDKFEINWIT